jgi:hypothetical protein
MKNKGIVVLVVSVMMLVASGLFAAGETAQNQQSQPTQKTHVTHKKKAKAKKLEVWVCPMKCEGGKTYSQQGKCPKCGMNLEKKT